MEYSLVSASNLHSMSLSILNEYFGYDAFRIGQQEIINSIVSGKDTLVIMPTGGGKSLCYQIPALMLPGTAIIISPLIALMKDQVDGLIERNIPAALINSTVSQHDQQIIARDIVNGRIKLLYISPERLQNPQFMAFLRTIEISFIAVDEAHCISEWGHDFRPAYTSISNAFKDLGKRPPIIALTATATPEVKDDIIRQLSLHFPFVHIGGFYRKNLHYQVIAADKKVRFLTRFLKDRSQKDTSGAIILYCGSRKRVEEYAMALQQSGLAVLSYHAGLPDTQRQRVQEQFLKEESPILIATNAFGMGVDKSNVRVVIHCDITLTLESYYQESGRAGRDGKDSECIVLYHPKDRDLMDFFLSCTYPSKQDIISVYNVLFAQTPIYGYLTQPILLSPEQIGNACGIHAIQVNTILGILERNQVLSNAGNKKSNAMIHIVAEQEELKERIVKMHDHDRGIMMALLRMLGPESMLRSVPFDMEKMIRTYHLQKIYVQEALRKFEQSGLIKLGQSAAHSGIMLLQQRFPPEEVPIDFMALQKRHEHALDKLDSVITYMETEICKQRYLLDYFRDVSNTITTCGSCSSCTVNEDISLHEQDIKDTFVRHSLLLQIQELNGYFGKKTIMSCILGDDKDTNVKKYQLQQSKLFGRLRGYAMFSVRDAFESLLEEHFAESSHGDYPVISITEKGRKLVKEQIVPLQIKLRSDPQKALLKALEKIRATIGKQDPMIHTYFTDPLMELLSITRPNTIEDLVNICSIPKDLANNYGPVFIAEILNSKTSQNMDSELSPTVRITYAFIKQHCSLDEIANSRKLTIGTIAQHVQQLIESEHEKECAYLISKELLRDMSKLYQRMPFALLKQYRAELGDGYEFAELRIALALIKKGVRA
ncbi:MAG: helicase RecQ [Bacteroidota bacterium]